MSLSSSPLGSAPISAWKDGSPTKYITTTTPPTIAVSSANAATLVYKYGTVKPKVNIKWQYNFGRKDFFVGVHWRKSETEFTPYINLEWQGETADIEIGIWWQRAETFQPTINIEWEGYATYTGPQNVESWDVTLTIGGVNYSAKLIDSIEIKYEEDVAATADFAIVPDAGVINTLDYMNEEVVIKATTNDGTIITTSQRYWGKIMAADYDPDARVIYLAATNDLQGYFEAQTKDQINSVFGGINNPSASLSAWWSPFVFNKEVTGWEYAQDLLSTVPVNMYINRYGNISFTSYTAKVTEDILFTDSTRFGNSLALTRATTRDLVNNVDINVDYLNYKLRERVVHYHLDHDYAACVYPSIRVPPPKLEDIYNVVSSIGWRLAEAPRVTYIGAVVPQERYVGGWGFNVENVCNFFYSIDDTGLNSAYWKVQLNYPDGIRNADFTAYKHWVLTSKETYTISVNAPESYDPNGDGSKINNFRTELDLGVESQYPVESWESAELDLTLLPGDYEYDVRSMDHEGNQVDLEIAQRTAINTAKKSILKSHRLNTVSCTVPFHHKLDIASTIKVQADYLTAKGRVRAYTETFDFASGDTRQDVQIALSLHGGTGLYFNTPVDPIDAPSSSGYAYEATMSNGTKIYAKNKNIQNYNKEIPTYVGGVSWTQSTANTINNYYGGCTDGYYANTTYDETNLAITKAVKSKWGLNTSTGYGLIGTNYYPGWEKTGIVITTDEITTDEVIQTDLGASGNYTVVIPEDLLTLTA